MPISLAETSEVLQEHLEEVLVAAATSNGREYIHQIRLPIEFLDVLLWLERQSSPFRLYWSSRGSRDWGGRCIKHFG